MNDVTNFLAALSKGLLSEERFILCGFKGDPDVASSSDWRPQPWAPSRELPFVTRDNVYVTVASFGKAEDGSYRRRQSTFAAGHALMIDDVGTKVHPSILKGIESSAIIETSPGNHQHWLFLEKPEREQIRFDALIRAFISAKLLGSDPGMAGVTRVGRLPGFVNGKPKHNGFVTKLVALKPEQRYSVKSLAAAFGLQLNFRPINPKDRLLPQGIPDERKVFFARTLRHLTRMQMLKRNRPDLSGWQEMHCPWRDNHTGAADTGAAIREPAADNGYHGAFRCHHGHCANKGWSQLTDWLGDVIADQLQDLPPFNKVHQ